MGSQERSLMYKLKSQDGTEIILKIFIGKNPWQKKRMEREKVALYVLKGLAVPKLVRIPRKVVAKLVKSKNFSYTAMENVPWAGCFARIFSATQSLGLWAFTLEQLCAFRRRQVLYTDMKHDHIRLSKNLDSALIIDYNDCVMVEQSGLYPHTIMGVTPELAAPEFYFSTILSERVIVYEMGMLLGAFLNKYFHNFHQEPRAFKKMEAKLSSVDAQDFYFLLRKCISQNPLERPKDLEVLFSQFQQLELPSAAIHLWKKLRAPYLKPLAELGFKDPVESEERSIGIKKAS